MRIRPAQQGDATQFAKLNQQFNGCSGPFGDLAGASERVLVAESGGQLVGFACVQINQSVCSESPRAELTELFVDTAMRRRGVGAALVSEAERFAWNSGCSELVLRTKADNREARALFTGCGFRVAEHVVFRKRESGCACEPAI